MSDVPNFLHTDPRTGSEIRELNKRAEKLFADLSTVMGDLAAHYRTALPKAKSKKLAMLRLDLKWNARRVARHGTNAAAACEAAAKSCRAMDRTYVDLFNPQGAGTRTRGIDLDA